MSERLRVGFVGLGLMGRPMALNVLRAGFEVLVWARRPEACEPLVEAGAKAVKSLRALGEECGVTVSVVSDGAAVAEVTLGEDGIAAGAQPGHVHVDMSTISPEEARAIGRALAARGVEFVDAPVSGGVVGAERGSLTIMVGGREEVVTRVQPILAAMGERITYVGPAGAGQVAKACNQVLTGVTVVAVAEALNLARAAGVDPERVREALLGGAAYSRILEQHGARMLARDFRPGFKGWMHAKDMGFVLEEGRRVGAPTLLSAVAAQLFQALVARGEGEEDSIAVLRLLEEWSQRGEKRA
ncbi:MAG: NAD(P)-dependent oxidoreductase [Hydrogenophilus sp.]|nr:NAD(P)-dependent oxidoreductase [Hydrogenophilus sp.]